MEVSTANHRSFHQFPHPHLLQNALLRSHTAAVFPESSRLPEVANSQRFSVLRVAHSAVCDLLHCGYDPLPSNLDYCSGVLRMKSATWEKKGSRKARAKAGTFVSFMASDMSLSQRSRSGMPILYGAWRMRRRGWPRFSM